MQADVPYGGQWQQLGGIFHEVFFASLRLMRKFSSQLRLCLCPTYDGADADGEACSSTEAPPSRPWLKAKLSFPFGPRLCRNSPSRPRS